MHAGKLFFILGPECKIVLFSIKTYMGKEKKETEKVNKEKERK